MTDHPKNHQDEVERQTEQWVTDALRHELIPLTEVEVAEANAREDAFDRELPENLKAYAPTKIVPNNVVALTPRGKLAWLGSTSFALLGAAAAVTVMWGVQKYESSTKPLVGQEPLVPNDANPVLPAAGRQVAIGPLPACSESCCAGPDCEAAKPNLKECVSQRRCIFCEPGTEDRYRLRIGRLAPSETTRFLLDKSPGRALELCVRVASSSLFCTPAQANTVEDEAWASLPLVATPADLLSGLTVHVRWVGEEDAMASWTKPVESNPTVLCSGISVKPKLPDGELVGSLSVFLDDPYYVELGRAASTKELLRLTSQLQFSGVAPLLYQTAATKVDRFAIALGPFDKRTAESLRWAVLHQGNEAKLVLGFDYLGTAARPSQP